MPKGGGKRKRPGGGGGRPAKRQKRKKKTRTEKREKYDEKVAKSLEKRRKQEEAELSSSSADEAPQPPTVSAYARLLQSYGVQRAAEAEEEPEPDEEQEEVEELEELEELERLAELEGEEEEEEEELEEGEEGGGAAGLYGSGHLGADDDDADSESSGASGGGADTRLSGAGAAWWRRHFCRSAAPGEAAQRAPAAVPGCGLAPQVTANVDWEALCAAAGAPAPAPPPAGPRRRRRQRGVAAPGGARGFADAVQLLFGGEGRGAPLHSELQRLWKRGRQLDDAAWTRPMFTVLSAYADLYWPLRTWDSAPALVDTAVCHMLTHVRRARAAVAANDAELGAAAAAGGEDDDDARGRDQGYWRPRVLVLLPMRNLCKEYVHRLIHVAGVPPGAVFNLERFDSDFGELKEDRDPKFQKRTPDYKQQFGGNIDDRFCFGVGVGRRRLKIFAAFPSADIIFASPLGLAYTMRTNAKQGADFLSSVEVAIVDQADALLMQNFEWTRKGLGATTQQPHSISGDITRIYRWLLDKEGPRFRQTVIFSRVADAELSALFKAEGRSHAGQVRCARSHAGEVTRVVNGARHLFHRIPVTSPGEAAAERFEYFEKRVFPRLSSGLGSGIGTLSALIIVPSYFDFVKVRNYLEGVDRDSFAELSEYTSPRDMFAAIRDFGAKRRSFLLMSERFYYYRRYVLRGVRTIIFYQLPVSTWFYSELVNQMELEGEGPTVLTLYSKYDALQLQRVLGTERARRVIAAESAAHMFC
eukprot:TRINITY_DN26006_c3_g1_i1.p1 TRINITY_DN26006_c3_g1~~TRINITY_DN26006_c3_g1_i1.p1  ORF type:complete len:782 (+),score=313.66 TRINITY_DN26006_c3_g1_i1:78-2348(+)